MKIEKIEPKENIKFNVGLSSKECQGLTRELDNLIRYSGKLWVDNPFLSGFYDLVEGK